MSKPTKRDANEAFGDDEPAPAVVKKRTRRKSKHRESKTPALAVTKQKGELGHDHSKNRGKEGNKPASTSKIDLRKEGSHRARKSGFEVSIQGGYFLDQDPVLSKDEQHLILPTKSHIHVYSAATSLLVRSICVDLVNSVTSCILCPSDPEHILVSTYGGTITKYNWATGRKLRKWKTRSELLRIYGLPASKSSDDGDTILAINQSSAGERDLSQYTLHHSPNVRLKEVVLRSKQKMALTIVILDDGRLFIASAGDRLILGYLQDLMSADYTWHEFTVPGKIVSFDARSRQASNTTTKTRSTVDVALGLQDGAILIYDDVLSRLIGNQKSSKGIEMISRRLYWHRDLVCSVKWSRDGNYLISGGRETVLVLWQLDTNQEQYLPHLSAPICNIVVSTSGSSYAMRMADNSVMVLSTSDLVPQTNISGVSAARGLGRRLRATISPNEPDQLLLATPSDLFPNPKSSFNPSATMLQTFDLRTSHQVSRQALARNMTTAVNVDPKGQRIGDPDVVQLQVSHDGLWLASVDEWTPPETDSEPLDRHVNQSRSLSRTETCLRFWSWKEGSKTWEMTTRIDGPHSAGHYSVLGLAVNPVRAEYASAGTDGYVRIWTPMLRLRNGLSIKNLAGEPLYTWTCLYELQPDPLSPSQSTSRAESAALAYSEDGSAIAISFMFAGRSRILHFVDSRTGFLRDRDSQAHLCPQGDVEMAFSGTRLLFLSDTFFVWDVVHFMAISSPIVLKKPFTRNNGRFLAANAFNGTFALALNPTDFKTPAVVVIFDAKQPGQVLHHGKIHGHVKALLPSIKGPGYVVVDGEARVIQIKPSDAARESLKLSSGSKDEAPKGLNDIFGGSKNDVGIGAPAGGARPRLSNAEGARLVSDGQPRSLEDILEQQAFSTLPSVSELFEKVAGLFRKAH